MTTNKMYQDDSRYVTKWLDPRDTVITRMGGRDKFESISVREWCELIAADIDGAEVCEDIDPDTGGPIICVKRVR